MLRIDSLKEFGSETVHRKDIPDAMNSYFCSLDKDLADKISPVANPLISGDFEMNKTKSKFQFRTIEVQEVRDAFAKVKTDKRFGIDNISSYFLKLALPFIENPWLSCLIRQLKQVCFQTHGKLLGLLLFTKMEIGLISFSFSFILFKFTTYN